MSASRIHCITDTVHREASVKKHQSNDDLEMEMERMKILPIHGIFLIISTLTVSIYLLKSFSFSLFARSE